MRTKIFFLLATMLLTSMCAFAQSGNNGTLKGDVNGDGVVDVADINAIIQIMKDGGGTGEETKYYWYVGPTPPTALPTNDSQLATGLDAGWRKISNTKPIAGTVIFDGTAQDEINIATTKVTQYFAINSDVTIGSYDSFGVDQTSSFLTGPTVSNGMNIFTSVGKSKTFGQIIKAK